MPGPLLGVLMTYFLRCCSQLVEFFGAFKRPDGSIRVVLEFMDRGSLADVMDYRATVQVRIECIL